MSATAPNESAPASLTSFLQSVLPLDTRSELCNSVLPALVDGIAEIAKALRSAHHVSQVGTANAFGDDQLNVDVASENIVRAALARCSSVLTASSEEDPIERPAHPGGAAAPAPAPAAEGEGEQYTIAFDPLDGSSIIAPNWTVGTIAGIWDGPTALGQDPATKQVAAVLGVYGPRTTAVVGLRVPGAPAVCFEVGIGEGGMADAQIVRASVALGAPPFKARYFAPANLRSAGENPRYMALINQFIAERYNLRYCGGLVPDIVHGLVKGHGLYVSPVTATSKAKLRRLYELFPIALILECAGGRAVDPADGSEILSRRAEDTDERAGLICGTAEEVEMVKSALLG
ncbi:fructose-1-6-bisphosphatase [Xylariales sp. PMI_506]|nr:fructose-1-6-bisphosphatase [Xylariales sp. PMI_506]